MDFVKNLHQLGLSENQAKVYVACLQLGSASVLHIAKSAGLKRPTVYLLLDELEAKGFVTRIIHGKRAVYRAESPERITNDLEDKLALCAEILPSLKAIHNFDPEKPTIKVAEGVQEVRETYNALFTYLKHHPGEELLIFGSLKDAVENFRTSVIDYFYQAMSKSQNPIREIGNDDSETRQYYRRSLRLNPHHQLRVIRSDGRFTQADNMLYGNTLIIFSFKKEIFAIKIESSAIAETYRTFFNMAWHAGKVV
ncbi:MAG: helix-turn-helix domain-containing protein [Candidatus Uhrbacteria bacterium]|nr:helix-turn-helix domain-containing protein [Candidatus Uhrbacteria bacterium]